MKSDIELQPGINELIKYIKTHYHLHDCEHIIENGNIIVCCGSNTGNVVIDLLEHIDAIRVFPNQLTSKEDRQEREKLILDIENQLASYRK